MLVNEMIRIGARRFAGVGIIAVGIPVYYLFARRRWEPFFPGPLIREASDKGSGSGDIPPCGRV